MLLMEKYVTLSNSFSVTIIFVIPRQVLINKSVANFIMSEIKKSYLIARIAPTMGHNNCTSIVPLYCNS